MKRYGFINTFISVCSGTSIFPEIVKFPFRRMVFHLFVLALIAGMVNVAFRYHPFNVVYEKSCSKLQKKFGDMVFSKKGILPTKNPEKAETVYLEDLKVDYYPDVEALKKYKLADDYKYFIIWTPRSIFWFTNIQGQISAVQPLLPPDITGDDLEKNKKLLTLLINNFLQSGDDDLSAYDIAEIFKTPEAYLEQKTVPIREVKMYVSSGWDCSITNFYIFFLFTDLLYKCMVSVPFFILIFSTFSFFLGKSNMLSMKFKELFVVGIYTGFPGIVIATLFTALDLPVLEFQSVFLIAYLFYSFPVFSRLRLAQMQKENPYGSERKE